MSANTNYSHVILFSQAQGQVQGAVQVSIFGRVSNEDDNKLLPNGGNYKGRWISNERKHSNEQRPHLVDKISSTLLDMIQQNLHSFQLTVEDKY